MRVRNPTGLTAVGIPGRIGFPGHSLTVAVKGLYRLEAGQVSEVLEDEDLAFPTGDVPVEGDEGDSSEIRYASDFAHYKPRADLLLTGRCHPPGGRPVASCRVTFQVGGRGRSLMVFGDRYWQRAGAGYRVTEPRPFEAMDLGWERSYGGPRCADNPVGRGHRPVETEDGRSFWPLPNVEAPEGLVSAPESRPAPAGFGPIPMEWEPRRSKAGTYSDRWLETRWPWYPEDLDWTLFNAAPLPMQVEGFLRGDEEVYLENVHPEAPHFRTRLPGTRVRCFLNELPPDHPPPPPQAKGEAEWSPPARDAMVFREVPLALDTVWVDAEEGMLALVWRGHVAVRGEEHEEVRDLFLSTEPLEEAPADPEAYRTAFWQLHDEEEGLIEEEEETEAEAAGGSDDAPTGEDEEEEEEADDSALDELRAELEEMGIDPDDPPRPSPEEMEQAKAFYRDRGMHDVVALLEAADEAEEEAEGDEEEEAAPEPWTRASVEECYARDGVLEGADLRGLDLSGVELAGASLGGCLLDGAILREASLAGADATGAQLAGADLSGADLSDAILEGADLKEAVLTSVKGTDAVLAGADLTGARLQEADLEGADLGQAVLDRVDARKASLSGAELGEARALGADFQGATLTGLRAGEAMDLSDSVFALASAADSVWAGATLARANFAYANLEGADFSGADLEGAELSATRLREARFGGARLVGARLVSADVFEGSFEKADLTRADLRGANLYGVEFLEARVHEASAEQANLKMTKYARRP